MSDGPPPEPEPREPGHYADLLATDHGGDVHARNLARRDADQGELSISTVH